MVGLNARILIVCLLALGGTVIAGAVRVRLPGNHVGYEPEQPIAFSHRLHAGELGIDCRYCHYGAPQSRHAGIPPGSVCMNCHRNVTAGFDAVLEERAAAEREGREPRQVVSPQLSRLYAALGLGDDLAPDPAAPAGDLRWVRVHNLPDFVYFDHRVHVARGLACETCHGPVQSMERVRQFSTLSMGWCVTCHRESPPMAGPPPADHATTDCSACHF